MMPSVWFHILCFSHYVLCPLQQLCGIPSRYQIQRVFQTCVTSQQQLIQCNTCNACFLVTGFDYSLYILPLYFSLGFSRF
jgi:hypothetical protein